MNDTDYIKNLPKKRMASGVIFLNEVGEILLLKPTYKEYWTVPGGVIEKDESPRDAALREVKEEIGLDLKSIHFLCIDYMSSKDSGYSTKDENMQFIFYGGTLDSEDLNKMQTPKDEISEYKFVAKEEAIKLVNDRLANRLKSCFGALEAGAPFYLEGGKIKD